jgi:2-polyprenyl-3-methyl-5-hydroxy-6-metoxy-1,4-benzoquinol methylase
MSVFARGRERVAGRVPPEVALEGSIREFARKPFSLLDLNEPQGELKYTQLLQSTYLRTLQDISAYFGRRGNNFSDLRILEIGAYLGMVSISLRKMGFQVSGSELPEFARNESLKARFGSYGIELASVNLRDRKLPFSSEGFDAVIMCEVLEHLNFNPLPVLLEINRVLKPGGLLYLATPNLACLKNRVRMLFGHSIRNPIEDYFLQLDLSQNMIVGLHWREYTKDELSKMLDKLGFTVERQVFFDMSKPGVDGLVKSSVKKLVYGLAPALRTNQVVFAIKRSTPFFQFQYVDATT